MSGKKRRVALAAPTLELRVRGNQLIEGVPNSRGPGELTGDKTPQTNTTTYEREFQRGKLKSFQIQELREDGNFPWRLIPQTGESGEVKENYP